MNSVVGAFAVAVAIVAGSNEGGGGTRVDTPREKTTAAETKTLLDGNITVEGFTTAIVRGTAKTDFSATLDDPAMMLGLRTGVVGDNLVVLSAAAFMMVIEPSAHTDSPFPSATPMPYSRKRLLLAGYAGVECGYNATLSELGSLVLRTLLGAGGAGHHPASGDGKYVGTDLFVVVEPSAEINIKASPDLTISIALGHRWAYGLDLAGVQPNADNRIDVLDGFTLDVGAGTKF